MLKANPKEFVNSYSDPTVASSPAGVLADNASAVASAIAIMGGQASAPVVGINAGGALVGGIAGASIGYGLGNRWDRTPGVIIGGLVGALAGSAIERSGC